MKLGFNFKKSLAVAALALGVSGCIGVNAAPKSVEISTDCEAPVVNSIDKNLESLSKERIKSILENVKEARRLFEELNDVLDNGLDVMTSFVNNFPDLKNLFFEDDLENAELFEECGALEIALMQFGENAKKFDRSKLEKISENLQQLI